MKKYIIICFIILVFLSSSFLGVSKPVEIKEEKLNLIDHLEQTSSNYFSTVRYTERSSESKTIIWDNGAPTDNWVLILSQLDEVFPFNAQVGDDFIFEDGDTEILGVRWWGNFWGVGEPFDPVDFNIYFYADDGTGYSPTGGGMGNPESTALESYFIQGISGVNDSGQRFYSVDLPSPFIASQGEKYWLIIQSKFEVLPKWGRATNDGTIHLAPSVFGCPLLGEPFWTDLGYGDVAWYLTGGINQPPDAPTITGPINGPPGVLIAFTFSAVDPDGDDVRFYIDWGDGNSESTSFVHSGLDITVSHMWSARGTFIITVYAEDEHGNIGPTSTNPIPITRNKSTSNMLLQRILERFPLLQKILQPGFRLLNK